ncbi:MAG: protein CpxP [Hyphomicrobiaceae bacterium]|jgi:protein CpxP
MTDKQATPKRTNRKVIAIAAVSAIVVGGAFGVQALANSKTGAHMMLASDGDSWHGGWRGGHHGKFANMTDAQIEKKISRVIKHVAIEIEATPDQQEKLTKLFVAVAKDVKPMRGQMRASGRKIHDLLLADKIDREALEKIRAARLADADRISKTVVNAIAEAAEVLDPEQRKVLNERVQQFKSMRRGRGWGHGWHRG